MSIPCVEVLMKALYQSEDVQHARAPGSLLWERLTLLTSKWNVIITEAVKEHSILLQVHLEDHEQKSRSFSSTAHTGRDGWREK